MQTNVLNITTVPARIDISTTKAMLSASCVKSGLDIEKTPASVDMRSKNITFDQDSSQCWAEEGHMTTAMLVAEYARDGMESVAEYAHSSAVIGQEIVHAQRGENVYREVEKAKRNGDIPNTTIKFIPSVKPVITWNENQLDIDGHPEKDTFNWTTSQFADVRLEREGSISVTETQEPEIHIEYTGDNNTLHLLDQRA